MECDSRVLEGVLKHLKMYALRSKVCRHVKNKPMRDNLFIGQCNFLFTKGVPYLLPNTFIPSMGVFNQLWQD